LNGEHHRRSWNHEKVVGACSIPLVGGSVYEVESAH